MTTHRLHHRIAELVSWACDNRLSAEDAQRAESLAVAGIGSLETLRIIDAVEQEFDVTLDIADPVHLDSVGALADLVAAQRLQSSPGAAEAQ